MHPLSESQCNRGHFSVRMWKSEKHQELGCANRRFQGPRGNGEHVVGKWCSWIMMRRWGRWLDGGRKQGQRTIERAELTAFLCLLRKVCGPIKVHVDNKGIIDGLRKGEKEEPEMQTCG